MLAILHHPAIRYSLSTRSTNDPEVVNGIRASIVP